MPKVQAAALDFDRDLNSGVREIICELADELREKGWDVEDLEHPKVKGVNQCEIIVFSTLLPTILRYRVNVKNVLDSLLMTFCKEFYRVEVVDLTDETGVTKAILQQWTFGAAVDEVAKLLGDVRNNKT